MVGSNSDKWPVAADSYINILQHPETAFHDVDLRSCEIKTDAAGVPDFASGGSAIVFKGRRKTGPKSGQEIAIRAFKSPVPHVQEHYNTVNKYVSQHPIRSLVTFDYSAKGIRAVGPNKRLNWYPLVTMEWVPGRTLWSWLPEKCRQSNKDELSLIADRWVELVEELRSAQVAHGDLQHGNIMVTDKGELRLIDYDCMYVPTMGCQKRNLETGLPPYQHRDRTTHTLLSRDIDNYSALFILVALKALAADPSLWLRYVEKRQIDSVLFATEDFEENALPAVFQDLKRSPDSDVAESVKVLFDAYRGGIDDVPPLTEVLFSYAKVEQLLGQRAFDDALELLTRRENSDDAPPQLKQRIHFAQRAADTRSKLEIAASAGDEMRMKELFEANAAYLDDYPAARDIVRVAERSPDVVGVLNDLGKFRTAERWRAYVCCWDEFVANWDSGKTIHENQETLKKRKSLQGVWPDVEKWREPNSTCNDVIIAWNAHPRDYLTLEHRWTRLLQSCKEANLLIHPEVRLDRVEIEHALKQFAAWNVFQQLPKIPSEENDRALNQAWPEADQHALFSDWGPARQPHELKAIGKVRSRLRILSELRRSIDAADSSSCAFAESRVNDIAGKLPKGYQYDQAERVHVAVQRCKALDAVKRAISQDSDITIYETWSRLGELKAKALLANSTETSLTALNPSARIELAQRRYPLISKLKQIPEDLLASELDESLLTIWDTALLDRCLDASPWKERHLVAVRRKHLLQRLNASIVTDDQPSVVKCADDPLLQDFAFPRESMHAIERAQHVKHSAHLILSTLQSRQRERFLEVFDANSVRQFLYLFDGHRAELVEMVRDTIAPLKSIGLDYPFFNPVLKAKSNGAYRIKWRWPPSRFADKCVMAVCGEEPKPGSPPGDWRLYSQWRIERRVWQNAAGSQTIHPKKGWIGGWVVVWALIELGDGVSEIRSDPLVIGRLG